ncbi:hypothetical protein [Phenylobacterium sp.]|uniref:hypothetical protein n=1 Tax=Phenylobacterium sp. TaxID=1871053 RepID=UPI00374C8BED
MRPMRLGLLAALIIAVMAPTAALAQRLPKAGGVTMPPPAKVTADARKQGMADAPALVGTAGVPCQVTDARLVGKVAADKKTGSLGSSLYEVACQGGMGYLLQSSATGATAFSCIEANNPADPATKPANPCILPANLDPMTAMAPLLAKAKINCAPDKVRGIGQTKTSTLIEVSCPGGSGYVLTGSAPLDTGKDATAVNCLAYDAADGNIKCILNPVTARNAVIDHFAQVANNGCTVKDRRFVGLFVDGTEGYEVSCADGKGYIYKVDSKGAIATTIDCAKAPGGSCTLTDTRAATAEQAGLYTRLAKSAGSSCQVSRYAVFPSAGDKEVVELVCGDGVGALGMFPATGKGVVLDCGHALLAGYKCTLGKPDFAGLTSDLRKFDKKECTVSSTGSPLKAADGTMRLEVACSDGLPGYMIVFENPSTAKDVIACSMAGNCILPTNKRKG